MKNNLLLMFTIVALTASAQARINETLVQCKARYGAPVAIMAASKPADKTFVFKTDDYDIVVLFLNDRAVELVFMPIDNADFSEKSVDELLNTNSEDSEFVQLKSSADRKLAEWTRKDKKVDALLGVTDDRPFLMIIDVQFGKDSE